jgi:hypothetical protein
VRFIDRANDRFQPGSAVYGSRFIRRDAALEQVLQGHRHAIWLLGLRHSGRTSLLLELRYRTQDPRIGPLTPLYLPLAGVRDAAGLAAALLRELSEARGLWQQHGIEPPAPEAGETPVNLLRAALRPVRAAERSLLFLVDDAEALVQVGEKDAVGLRRLLKLLSSGKGLRTVVAASPLLESLSAAASFEGPLLADFLPPLYLGALELEALEAHLEPALDAGQVRAVHAATGGHPYLVQLVASLCLSGLEVETAILRVESDPLVREEVLGALRALDEDELRLLGALARAEDPQVLERPVLRLLQLGLLRRQATGGRPEIAGRLLRQWLAGRVPEPVQPVPAAFRSLGPFELRELLGQGAWSRVYRAVDGRTGREVALKVLSAERDAADQAARFVREARTYTRLEHPSIVTLYEAGQIDGACFLAMELCEGRPLRERLAAGPMPVAEVLGVATALASALLYAHSQGVVHRDLNPSNVLLPPSGPPKLLDFGLAKGLRSAAGLTASVSLASLTGAGTLLGTFAYMSPEQAQGLAVDQRSDQFSLGIVLYEMLAGRHPFQAASTYRLVHRLVHEPPTPLDETARELPFMLHVALDRLLQKSPQDRFGTLAELLELLEPLAGAA